MRTSFQCGRQTICLDLPDNTTIYESRFPAASGSAERLVADALGSPIGTPPLAQLLAGRRQGDVVIVVSDITRPIPYATFLPEMLRTIEAAGVPRQEILILIATGMHRPSTPEERCQMFSPEVAANYRIEDHIASAADHVSLPGKSWSGATVRLNRRYVQAGFRILTGLVEPHFMAGFSGGRKSICPGLVDLATLRQFHGFRILSDQRACNGQLEDNPCHLEASSVARQIGADLILNVVLDRARRVIRAFAGELDAAHAAACEFVAQCSCPKVRQVADVAVTSSGGYPLDATFYQCMKGVVTALPTVKAGGTILAFGGCCEGVGSTEYTETLRKYSGRWQEFLRDIATQAKFTKDQWQFQMQCRALEKVGQANLHFYTPGLEAATLAELSVVPHATSDVGGALQRAIDEAMAAGKTIAAFPEGPYCAPR